MKVTFEDLVKEIDFLHSELATSLTSELIYAAQDDGFYDVKLLINGQEVEPKLLNDIADNLEQYIQAAAKQLIREKLEAAEEKANELLSFVQRVSENLKDEFDLI